MVRKIKGQRRNLILINTKGGEISIDALVDVMPSGMTKAQIWSWLTAQAGTQAAYIPPVSMMSSEMEAIIPSTSVLVKVGDAWYTNWAGHRVLVNKYVLLPSDLPAEILSAMTRKGMEVVSLHDLVSKAPSVADTYLTFGIVPPSYMYSGAELSDDAIKALAKAYNISEAEVRTLVKSTAYSLADISSSLQRTYPELTLDKLKTLLEYRSDPSKTVSISKPSVSTPAEPTKISDLSSTELTSVLSSLDSSALSSVLPSLSPTQMSSLTEKQITSLTPAQISSLSPRQIAVLLSRPDLSRSTISYILKSLPYTSPDLLSLLSYPRVPGGYPSGIPSLPPTKARRRIDEISRQLKKIPRSRFLEPYKVSFMYSADSESHRVHARAFRDALILGFKLKKKPDDPVEVEVRKLEMRGRR